MNGIAIKLNKTTEAGPDIETVYFATMRKAPQLRDLLRRMMVAEGSLAAAGRIQSLAAQTMATADDASRITEARRELEKALLDLDDAAQELIDARQAFLSEGFKAAGYDDASAERLASEIPAEKLSDVIAATRVGSGMMDFSFASRPSA